MEVEPLRPGELESFVDELWVPAQREMAALSEYTLADAEAVRRNGLEHRRARLAEDDRVTYVARGEAFLGYASAEVGTPPPIFRQERECHVGELYVREGARRAGVASALLDRVEEWARRRNCVRLGLNVDVENRAARALYEQRGLDVRRHEMKKRLDEE